MTTESGAALSRVWQEIEARMDADATSVVSRMIHSRAERYRKQPWLLDSLFPGLSTATPEALVARADALLEQADAGELPRWYGLGGENITISLRAARRLGEMLVAENREAVQ